jgi:hypothetical protein
MAGGWIQAGLLASLADKGGLPAWKWIFIIVSVMTIPVALFGTSPTRSFRDGSTQQYYRLDIHSRSPFSSRSLVLEQRTERTCNHATRCAPQTVLGFDGIQESAFELAILVTALYFYV